MRLQPSVPPLRKGGGGGRGEVDLRMYVLRYRTLTHEVAGATIFYHIIPQLQLPLLLLLLLTLLLLLLLTPPALPHTSVVSSLAIA